MTRKRLSNVQALRGVAALLVLAMHATVRQVKSFGADGAGMREAAHVARSIGHLGVDLFFVISGFIIFTVVTQASQRSTTGVARLREAGQFLWRRALRIYPLYWLTAAVMLALSGLFPRLDADPSARLLPQVLLVTRHIDMHYVAWTLAFEMYFYGVVAACLLAFGARAKLGVAFWIITETVLIAAWCIAPDSDSWLAYWRHSILLDPMVLEFGLGCGVAALVAHRPRLPAIPLTVAALVPITIGAWQLHARPMIGLTADPYLRLAYFGTGATLLLTGAVLLERQDRWVAPRWLQALGDASFTLSLAYPGDHRARRAGPSGSVRMVEGERRHGASGERRSAARRICELPLDRTAIAGPSQGLAARKY
ncbi:MAG: acyltransferase [Candidatus Binatia bacterium]